MWGSCFSLGSRRGTLRLRLLRRRLLLTHSSLTHSLTHSLTRSLSLTHSLTHSHSHSHSHSPTHSLTYSLSLTHSLTPSLSHSLTPSLPPSLTHSRTHSLTQVQHGCLSRGRRSRRSLLVELRRTWAPLGRGCLFVWQAQYREVAGQAAERVGAAGPRLHFVLKAQCTEPPG